MTSTDFHARNLILRAAEKKSRPLVDDAFALLESNWERFGDNFSPELLVLFAEVASDLRERESLVIRALRLYDRLRCDEDQFRARALLVRCVYEARRGTDEFRLKGLHALQQLQYALKFLKDALALATKQPFDQKYGFLVYNASLVFWDVVRPMCRYGWQRHIINETLQVLDALKLVRSSAGGAQDAKGKGAPGGVAIPVDVDGVWIAELLLSAAFGLEDASRDADATARSTEALTLLEEQRTREIKEAKEGLDAVSGGTDIVALDIALDLADALFQIWNAGAAEQAVLKSSREARAILAKSAEPTSRVGVDEKRLAQSRKAARLRSLALSAKAYFARKQGPGKTREEIDAAAASTTLGTALFVRNRGISADAAEEELIKAWTSVDSDFNLREAKEKYNPQMSPHEQGGPRSQLKPNKILELATLLRAACDACCWAVAQPMLARLEKFQVPLGRGRILADLCKAEVAVYQAQTVKATDPTTKMLLSTKQQAQREIEARVQAVKACEQCVLAASRLDEAELLEDAAVVMYRLGRELMCDEHRVRIHGSMQRCADLLEEIQSIRLAQLRVQLHMEVARCEIASDLLTKGQAEFIRASGIDYSVVESELSAVASKQLSEEPTRDPAPYVRCFDPSIKEQSRLLHWKTNLYEEASLVVDQVSLTLDQVQRQGPMKAGLSITLMHQAYAKLKAQFQELEGDRIGQLAPSFTPPPRTVTSSEPLKLLPHHAPALISAGGPSAAELQLSGQAAPAPIQDQRPQSEQEEGMCQAKAIISLFCKLAREAYKREEINLALDVCRTVDAATATVDFGPPPVEVEGALLLAEAAFIKAQCLDRQLEALGVINGIDDEIEDPEEAARRAAAEAAAEEDSSDEDMELEGEFDELTPEEKAEAVAKKREMMKALLYGMEKSCEFKQWWMVSNGITLWWNLHLQLVEMSSKDTTLLERTLPEYRDGLGSMQKYFSGPPEVQIPDSELKRALAVGILLAYIEVSVVSGQMQVLDVDQLLVLKRLDSAERKHAMGRIAELCKANNKPLPDIARLRLDRLEGASAAAAAPKKGAAPPPTSADKSDLMGNEVEIMQALISAPYEQTEDSAMKNVERAKELLGAWEPKSSDEAMLTLWTEMWTRLGRQCLREPVSKETPGGASVGGKYALMCGIKALGAVDSPMPRHASKERMRWRGACHALCGEAFARLVDPQRQEKESLLALRRMAVEQFKNCCAYALETKCEELASFGARNLWNIALPLLDSAQTRQLLIEPLRRATKALGAVRYSDDPFFLLSLYVALFDCYRDNGQWSAINEMLNEAFACVPSKPDSCHRRLWSLRMLALSKQGKNVTLVMGQMKETQERGKARIWMVLAHASKNRSDQLEGYANAIQILHKAEQPDVVELRVEFADWLVRNGFSKADALEQLALANDTLLEILDDESEDEDDEDTRSRFGASEAGFSKKSGQGPRSVCGRSVASSGRRSVAARSQRSKMSRGSRGSRASRMSRGTSRASSRRGGSASSVATKAKKERMNEEDEAPMERLYAHNYDQLMRVQATMSAMCSGDEFHGALLAAVQFATRFFVDTLELANGAAQQLGNQVATALAAEEQAKADGLSPEAVSRRNSKASSRNKEKKKADVVFVIKAAFAPPLRLCDWAVEENWMWKTSQDLLSEIFTRATKDRLVAKEGVSWAGHAEAFRKPALTFHHLSRLEVDLEDQCLQLWVFPVLALHLNLAASFPEGPLQDAMVCLAYMRLSRNAAQCRLLKAAASATAKWRDMLPKLIDTFGSFAETLEQVRNQRGGHGVMEADWMQASGDSSRSIGKAWARNELCAYEVWSELAKECRVHGEQFLASKLAAEAGMHAEAYGDSKVLRNILLVKGQLAYEEGNYGAVIAIAKKILVPANDNSAADVDQLVGVSRLLADTYVAARKLGLAVEVLKDALKAIDRAQEASSAALASGSPRRSMSQAASKQSAAIVRARCSIRSAEAHVELSRLALVLFPNKAWMQSLDSAIQLHTEVIDSLCNENQYSQAIHDCLGFAEVMEQIIDVKRIDLSRNPNLGIRGEGVLSFGVLADLANKLCESFVRCQRTRDALLALAVPIEGLDSGAVSPAEVLCAKFDVWHARAKYLRHILEYADEAEQASQESEHSGAIFRKRLPEGDVSVYRKEKTPADAKIEWEQKITSQIDEAEKRNSAAREASEMEESLMLVASAVTSLQQLADRPADADAPPTKELPGALTEALAELGRLHIEIASAKWALGQLQHPAPGADSFWDAAIGSDWREDGGMCAAERCSNVLAGRDPAVVFEAPRGEKSSELEGLSCERDSVKEQEPLPHWQAGTSILCKAAQMGIEGMHLLAAKRALRVLALQSYGRRCPEGAFESLILLQSVDVCSQAEVAFADLLPSDHNEAVQLRMLRSLERSWAVPQIVDSYRTTVDRLQRESPLFQRIRLSSMPPVNEMLLSYLPPLTLVVTLQMYDDKLYVGAVCSPPDGDAARRREQIRPFVSRIDVKDSDLHACLMKLGDLNAAIEKELIASSRLSSAHEEEYKATLKAVEEHFAADVAKQLSLHFWEYGVSVDHPCNPKQMVFLLDRMLWGLPLERFDCFLTLFSSNQSNPCFASVSRDLSFHLLAHRLSKQVEDPTSGKPLQPRVAAARPETTALYTDTFNEDEVLSSDAPNSEVLCSVHKRLVDSKVIGGERLCLHGQMHSASPAGTRLTMADATVFYSLGFGRFQNLASSSQLSAQDMRHVALLGIFHHAINFNAFRRHSKAESSKSLQLQALETSYGLNLVTGFRGVQCAVQSVSPIPTALAMRTFELFVRGMQAGKTVAKALEEALGARTKNPELRYARPAENGMLPGGIPLMVGGPDPADAKGKKAPSPTPGDSGEDTHDVLPFHTRAAYCLVGVPWVVAEGEAGGKKK